MDKKICFSCKEEKSLSEFHLSTDRGHQRECKECTRKRRSLWWKSDKGKRSSANTKLKQRFGVTLEDYERYVSAKGGVCEICGQPQSTNGDRLALDHDHTTEEVRGVLCKSCNLGIAQFKEDPELLKSASEYVERIKR